MDSGARNSGHGSHFGHLTWRHLNMLPLAHYYKALFKPVCTAEGTLSPFAQRVVPAQGRRGGTNDN